MTFEAPVGKVITKMVFNNAKWNDGNTADTGTFDGNTWTGEAKKVVVTVAGNTQMNSIEIWPADYVPTPVEVPFGMATSTYIFNADSERPYYDPAELTLQSFTNTTITKFIEVAAMPAAPSVVSVDFDEWSSSVTCLIPAVATNGETLNPKKQFYTVWIEKDGHQRG